MFFVITLINSAYFLWKVKFIFSFIFIYILFVMIISQTKPQNTIKSSLQVFIPLNTKYDILKNFYFFVRVMEVIGVQNNTDLNCRDRNIAHSFGSA